MEYFNSYVTEHNLMKYVQLGCKVADVGVCESHSNDLYSECAISAGKYWKVTVERSGEVFERYYDFVMVAVGFNNMPFIPDEVKEVLKGFSGKVLHSSKYQSWEDFENQKVLVCGFGNSGGDIACELSRHAEQVYLSSKHGGYVLNRLRFSGYPSDIILLKHVSNLLPMWLRSSMLPWICNEIFDHKKFGLEPLDSLMSNLPVVNDEIWIRISTGKLLMKSGILKSSNKTVFFLDGTKEDDVDTIILCTGFRRNFSFLKDQELLGMSVDGKFLSLYQWIFPVKHTGRVAIIGATGVQGSVFPVYEMQSRYAVEVFRGAVNLPSRKEMDEHLLKRLLKYKKFAKYQKEPLSVNYISYQDELADRIGAKPSLWKLLLSDPILALSIFFGPSCPYQYRLMGPGSWFGARNALLTVDKRIWSQFSRQSKHYLSTPFYRFFLALLFFLGVCAIVIYFLH